jgi:hypothetical protein
MYDFNMEIYSVVSTEDCRAFSVISTFLGQKFY